MDIGVQSGDPPMVSVCASEQHRQHNTQDHTPPRRLSKLVFSTRGRARTPSDTRVWQDLDERFPFAAVCAVCPSCLG